MSASFNHLPCNFHHPRHSRRPAGDNYLDWQGRNGSIGTAPAAGILVTGQRGCRSADAGNDLDAGLNTR